ncbi:MAG: mevalonate kinase family protein [Jiangellaceae bacterium]
MIQAVAESGAPPAFHAELDTDDFFADGGSKIGLGSSAALTVALAGALFTAAGRRAPTVDWLIDAHRRMQDGRGSGLDIAASLRGGVLIYRLGSEAVDAAPVSLPPEIEWCCVWSGVSASTSDFLQKIAQWREREPSRYAALMAELTETADAGVTAVRHGDGAALLDAVTSYAELLARFGADSGSDIVSREHREIGAAAAASGVPYKTCGAGGGDIGIALAANVGKLAEFRRLIGQAGFRALDLAVDPQGLSVRVSHE